MQRAGLTNRQARRSAGRYESSYRNVIHL